MGTGKSRVFRVLCLVLAGGPLSLGCTDASRGPLTVPPASMTTAPEANVQLAGSQKESAATGPALDRFLAVLKTAEDALVSAHAEDPRSKRVALALSKGSLRQALFRLQILSDLYMDNVTELKAFKKEATELEDRIGDVRYHLQVIEDQDDAGARDSDKKQSDQVKKLEKSVERLAKHLKRANWLPEQQKGRDSEIVAVPKINALRHDLLKADWSRAGDEPNALLGQLCLMALRLDAEPWDMQKHLDDKLGLHTLKKVLRKQRLQVDVLMDDVLEKDSKACSRDAVLSDLAPTLDDVDPKQFCNATLVDVGLLRQGGKTTCSLSPCYLEQIEKLYRTLSDAKDEGEALAEQGETLTKEQRDQIQTAWEDFKSQEVLRKLSLELVSCRVD
jgi:hypothetical protein